LQESAIISSSAEEHVLYQIANAPMREYPYAHLYADNVFPEDFYSQLRAHWPSSSSLVSLGDTGRVPKGAYPERFILPFSQDALQKLDEKRRPFWLEFGDWFLSSRFMSAVIDKFERPVRARFGNDIYRNSYSAESLVVRDHTNYSIGPHTDAPHRLLSMLFYCPDDDSRRHLGTSIYLPNDPDFRCAGGPHYPHRRFRKVKTMEYRRNSLFAFIKNDHSFHGVDPIGDQQVERDVLLYDIRVEQPPSAEPAPSAGLGLRLLKKLIGNRD
jgi:hypothetical protein